MWYIVRQEVAMEKTKLTVRVPRDLLEDAKRYAQEHDTSLTRLISEYLRRLSIEAGSPQDAPVVQRLSGILSPDVDLADYRQYLEEKYGDRA
jgi:hypothetical protein